MEKIFLGIKHFFAKIFNLLLLVVFIFLVAFCQIKRDQYKYQASRLEVLEMQRLLSKDGINFEKSLNKPRAYSREMVRFDFEGGFMQQYKRNTLLIDIYSSSEVIVQVLESGSKAVISCTECVSIIKEIKSE